MTASTNQLTGRKSISSRVDLSSLLSRSSWSIRMMGLHLDSPGFLDLGVGGHDVERDETEHLVVGFVVGDLRVEREG